MGLCIYLFLGVSFFTVSSAGPADILRDPTFQRLADLELLLSQIIDRTLEDINCVAIFRDERYSKVFGKTFYSTLRDVPSYMVEIKDSEDLLAPNYKTLKLIKRVRRSGCRFTIIFLSSGEQVGRFLRFGDRYELMTVPFPNPIPEILRLHRVDIWRLGAFKKYAVPFRDKTSDLLGHSLRAVTFQHVPAAFKMPAPTTHKSVTLEGMEPVGFAGLEIEVLTTLARIMNFDSYVYDVPDNELWGQETTNGSYTGLTGEISEGRADFALGDLHHTPHNLRYMDLTIPYNTQCLTFLTPEALTDNSWQTLILPFKGYLWAGVLVSLVAGSITFYVLAKLQEVMNAEVHTQMDDVRRRGAALTVHNNLAPQQQTEGLYQFSQPDNSVLYTFSMLLLVSLPKLPTGWSLRVLTGCWWIYSILVVVAYRASMTAILANPAPRVTIDTLEQLADSKIAVGGWGEQIKKFFQTSLDKAGKKIGSRFEIEKDVDLAVERVAKGEFAYYENIYFLKHATVRRHILATRASHRSTTLTEPSNNDRNLHIMSNCVIYMPISLGLQKNSPLKPRVDRYLRLITQAGLVEKWLRDAMGTVLSADRSDTVQSQKALMNLKKFLGALVALGVGYGISCAVLLFEIIYWHFTVTRHPSYDRYSNSIVISRKVINKEPNNKV